MCSQSRTKVEALGFKSMNPFNEQDAFDLMNSDKFLAPIFLKSKRQRLERKFARRFNEFLLNERVPWRASYKEYLRSERWKLFRLSIIAKRGKMCERCGKFKDGVDASSDLRSTRPRTTGGCETALPRLSQFDAPAITENRLEGHRMTEPREGSTEEITIRVCAHCLCEISMEGCSYGCDWDFDLNSPKGLFRKQFEVRIRIDGSHAVNRAIMTLDPEKLALDEKDFLEQCRISRETSPTIGYYAPPQC